MAKDNGSTGQDTSPPPSPSVDPNRFSAVDGNINNIHGNLQAAIAIIDCVSVVAALERTRRQSEAPGTDGEMQTGDGFAGGYTVSDDSMPTALLHASKLLELVRKDADAVFERAIVGGRHASH